MPDPTMGIVCPTQPADHGTVIGIEASTALDASAASPADHRLAADLATQAGASLLSLRATRGFAEPEELRKTADRSAHLEISEALAVARPTDALLSEEGVDDPARLAAARRPSISKRSARTSAPAIDARATPPAPPQTSPTESARLDTRWTSERRRERVEFQERAPAAASTMCGIA